MARINIEDSLFKDPRYQRLMIKMGCEFKALGVMHAAYSLAQKFWVPARRPIPRDDWNKSGIPDVVIDLGLATENEKGISVAGSDEQFAWLIKRRESGRKGGLSKAKAELGNEPENPSKAKAELGNEPENPSKPELSEASYSPSSSSSYSPSNSDSTSGKERPPLQADKAAELPPLARLWNSNADERLPKVRSMTRSSKRRKSCEARWSENPDPDYWRKVIQKINETPGLCGENERNWRADIEFLCRTDTGEKVLEGKYDGWDRPNRPKTFAELRSEKNRGLIEEFADWEDE